MLRRTYIIVFVLFMSIFLINSCQSENIIEEKETGGDFKEQVYLKSFQFKYTDNPLILLEDISCELIDNKIVAHIPHVAMNKKLVASFELENQAKMFLADTYEEVVSGEVVIDFSSPVNIIVIGRERIRVEYIISVSLFTELPMVFIDTEAMVEIDQKDDYIDARFTMYNFQQDKAEPHIKDAKIGIRGRGNSTWAMPKKPYKVKFDKKTSIWGREKNKHWVLLADYTDKTQLRNKMALHMGEISNLAWTPYGEHVEVFINNRYEGTYLLVEQVKAADGRVEVGNNGYLLEIDERAGGDDVYFRTKNNIPIVIKSPEVTVGDSEYNWIVNYFEAFEDALFNSNSNKDIYDYIDLESFVDWYLINEITKNNDAIDFSSCFMNLSKGGKLKRGPLWDFDISIGNINYNDNHDPAGFWVAKSLTYSRLFEDETFVEAVKERFNYFNSNRDILQVYLDSEAQKLKWAMLENDKRWNHLLDPLWPNNAVWGSHEDEVLYLKIWLDARFSWLEAMYANM